MFLSSSGSSASQLCPQVSIVPDACFQAMPGKATQIKLTPCCATDQGGAKQAEWDGSPRQTQTVDDSSLQLQASIWKLVGEGGIISSFDIDHVYFSADVTLMQEIVTPADKVKTATYIPTMSKPYVQHTFASTVVTEWPVVVGTKAHGKPEQRQKLATAIQKIVPNRIISEKTIAHLWQNDEELIQFQADPLAVFSAQSILKKDRTARAKNVLLDGASFEVSMPQLLQALIDAGEEKIDVYQLGQKAIFAQESDLFRV
jgi:hypothetical protein